MSGGGESVGYADFLIKSCNGLKISEDVIISEIASTATDTISITKILVILCISNGCII